MTITERPITAQERAHVAAVHAHMAAVVAVAADPAALPRLASLLADDFTWCTPSANPQRGVVRSRADYLAMLSNPAVVPEPARFASLDLRIQSTLVQGCRVAGESESIGQRRDGLAYHNYYHQLWRFDDHGRILEYRIYDDSAHVAAIHAAGNVKIVREFLESFAAASPFDVASQLADELTWTVQSATTAAQPIGKQKTLAIRANLHTSGQRLIIEIAPDGITADGDRIAVEATSVRHEAQRAQTSRHHCVFLLEGGLIKTIREYSLGTPIINAVAG
jgi:ketosteroid isomerase-like protein